MSLWEIYKAKRLGYADDLWTSLIGKKLGGYSWISTDYEQTPYIYRAMPNMSHYYNREIMDAVVGGSVGWNQLVDGSDADYLGNYATVSYSSADNEFLITFNAADVGVGLYNASAYDGIPSGHKCLISCSVKASGSIKFRFYLNNASSGYTQTPTTSYKQFATILNTSTANQFDVFARDTTIDGTMTVKDLQLTDLTLALGSTIADYVYSLEQATAGSGVAWLKQNFPKMFGQYNPYDSGSIQSVCGLVSHDTVGFNAWDEEWEQGLINVSTGELSSSTITIRSKTYCPILPSTTYYMTCGKTDGGSQNRYYLAIIFYDEDKDFIGGGYYNNLTFETPANARYFKIVTNTSTVVYGGTYNHDICINLSWDGSRNGEYEPYQKWSYPLDSDLELRGKFKLDANNNLYADGDVYEADGTVTRKYGIVDLGTLTWAKAGDGYKAGVTLDLTSLSKTYSGWGTDIPSAICSKYVPATGSSVYLHSEDKTFGFDGTAKLYVYDSTYEDSDAAAFKTAMSGVYLVYELATPTTETADPFTKVQVCDSGGTEEFVTSGIVSVGHKSKYAEK